MRYVVIYAWIGAIWLSGVGFGWALAHYLQDRQAWDEDRQAWDDEDGGS